MKIRFQADNDFSETIIRGVLGHEPGIDFRTARAARLHGVSDIEVLAVAADDGRVLVSHDFATMPQYFLEFTRQRSSPGVFLIRQSLALGKAIEALLMVWEASDANEWIDRLWILPSLVTIASAD